MSIFVDRNLDARQELSGQLRLQNRESEATVSAITVPLIPALHTGGGFLPAKNFR